MGKIALRDEYVVCHAPAYPDPASPWPQTPEGAHEFAKRHGGEVKHRLVTEWESLTEKTLLSNDMAAVLVEG